MISWKPNHDFKLFKQSRTPHRGSNLHLLTPGQRRENRRSGLARASIGLRFHLIAAIYNHELAD